MLAVLAGAAFHAMWNALVKSGTDSLLDTVMISAGVAAASGLVLMLVPAPHPSSWPFLAASAAVHLLYFGLMALAYRGSELSRIYPIMRGAAPAITVVMAALLLHEQPSWSGWAGVFLVSAGILLLAANSPRSPNVRLAPVCFALLLAVVVLKEKISALRWISITIVTAGAIALKGF
jgi:drug/metabolite transporter (DMT)-like permease